MAPPQCRMPPSHSPSGPLLALVLRCALDDGAAQCAVTALLGARRHFWCVASALRKDVVEYGAAFCAKSTCSAPCHSSLASRAARCTHSMGDFAERTTFMPPLAELQVEQLYDEECFAPAAQGLGLYKAQLRTLSAKAHDATRRLALALAANETAAAK